MAKVAGAIDATVRLLETVIQTPTHLHIPHRCREGNGDPARLAGSVLELVKWSNGGKFVMKWWTFVSYCIGSSSLTLP